MYKYIQSKFSIEFLRSYCLYWQTPQETIFNLLRVDLYRLEEQYYLYNFPQSEINTSISDLGYITPTYLTLQIHLAS
jgi:hypothetical protein